MVLQHRFIFFPVWVCLFASCNLFAKSQPPENQGKSYMSWFLVAAFGVLPVTYLLLRPDKPASLSDNKAAGKNHPEGIMTASTGSMGDLSSPSHPGFGETGRAKNHPAFIHAISGKEKKKLAKMNDREKQLLAADYMLGKR